jgi:hypothetical protein
MLTVSTFASAITFNIILKPSGGTQPAPALLYLSYANSLFCGAILGCILIKVTIELCRSTIDYVPEWKKLVEKAKAEHSMKGEEAGSKGGTVHKAVEQKLQDEIVHKFVEQGDKYDSVLRWLFKRPDSAEKAKSFAFFVLNAEAILVGATLFVAVYLLLLSCKFFLQINGPFLAGTIIYGLFGFLTFLLTASSMTIGHAMRSRVKVKQQEEGKKAEKRGATRTTKLLGEEDNKKRGPKGMNTSHVDLENGEHCTGRGR